MLRDSKAVSARNIFTNLEQIVDSDPVVLGVRDLLDHLQGDGLEAGQRQQDLPEPAPGVVLSVADVVFQIHLNVITATIFGQQIAVAPIRMWRKMSTKFRGNVVFTILA